jgi:HEAT repeat protein
MTTDSALDRWLAAIAADDDAAAEALVAQLRGDDEPALIALLTSASEDERWWSVRALAVHGSAAAPVHVAQAATDPAPSVRAAAALSLAELNRRVPEAVEPHLGALAPLLADDDGLVRQAAADALAQCGDAAVATLGGVVRGSVEAARTRAAYALRKIHTYKAAAILYPLLNDPNPLVRTYAYEGLDDMGLLETILLRP